MSHMKTGIALILSTFVLTHGAWGQSEEASAKEKASVKADEPELGPWTKKLSLGVNTSFGSSSSVIGQTDGESSTFGFKLDSELNYKTQKHEWRQSFNLNEATTKSPTIPRYVKSND